MAILTREKAKAWKPAYERVDVPEIEPGAHVNVKTLTLAEVRNRAVPLIKEKGDTTAEMVVLFAVDDEGAPIFSAEDVESISGMPGVACQRIAIAGLKLNGLLDESKTDDGDEADAKSAAEEAAGN